MALNPSSGWSYYKQIDLTDSSSVSEDYQMRLTVYAGAGSDDTATGKIYCNSYCNDFPNDIRFGTTNDPSTATQLKYWVMDSDASEAVIFVKMVAANTIYMFVGHSTATSDSSGTDTWEDFEDWSSDNTGDYTEYKRSGYYDYFYTRAYSWGNNKRYGTYFYFDTWSTSNFGAGAALACQESASPSTWPTDGDMNNFYLGWTDTDQGASSTLAATHLQARNEGSITNSGWTTWTKGAGTGTWFVGELCQTSTAVDGLIYSKDCLTTLKSSTVVSNLPDDIAYIGYNEGTGDTRSPGHYWAHDAGNNCLSWGGNRSASYGQVDIHTRYSWVGKYADTPPTYNTFGSWTAISAGGGGSPELYIDTATYDNESYIINDGWLI